ncbi:class 3 adenylate cyclase [Tepidamorphus gemmatus]|uniref:Class 3 adenylate cyclase n=1 Tax=Tepidamorphus gemmatus TaxID=747076 RepID=A0A4R3LUD1_9HYPH|nr:adenylate/guanylate cyclase domain-containing protein [Tepidamorphus gemmatus]TCT04172.1 class 3 adenylate cyclase [Tepidamorphus gemmatus]
MSVEAAERDAERIAALARAAGALILGGGLLAAAAIVPEAEAGYLLPRLALGLATVVGFLALAGLSWLVSRSSVYRPWVAYLFVACDALLIGFALQQGLQLAGHPGPWVYAEPATWLMPIIIAIQSVRFRSGPVVFAGALLLLVVLGLMAFGGADRDPVASQNDRLTGLLSWPPDVMRVLMLAVAAAVLAISVRSKRDILVRGLGTARREAELKRFLPDEVSRALARADGAGAPAGQQTLAIVFIDLIGFTAASEGVAPGEVARWLAGFRERIAALVRAKGGFVDKFIGDGVLAIFGYAGAADDQLRRGARQALATVADLPAMMAAWQADDPAVPTFRAVAGAALGPVFVGIVGSGERREFTVVGDAVNLASRLEGLAKQRGAGAALAAELVEQSGVAVPQSWGSETLAVRGRAAPVRVHLVPAD